MSNDCENGYRVTLPDGNELEPCFFELDEVIHNCTVEILRCPKCGKISIGWYPEGSYENEDD